MLIAQCLSHSAYSTVQIAKLFFSYSANKLAQPRKKIARTRPQRPRVFPSLVRTIHPCPCMYSFCYHYQGSIDSNAVKINCTVGMDFPIHSLGMDWWLENGRTQCTDRTLCTGQQLVGCSSYIVASAGGARSQACHGIATRVNSHTGVSSAQLCCRPQQLQCTEDDSLLPAFPTKVRRPTVTEVLPSPLHLLSSQYILLHSLQLASLLCIWIESIARLFCTQASFPWN